MDLFEEFNYKYNFLSKENVILMVLLISTVFLIYKNYQTPVSKKSFLFGVYLYIAVALLFITFASKYISTLDFINNQNYFKFIILYLIMSFGSLFIIMQKNMLVNHIGFILFILSLSLITGMSINSTTNTNVYKTVFITAGIVLILTGVVFTSSEETLNKMQNWMPNLMLLLCGLIVANFISIIFFPTLSTIKLLSFVGVILFIFIILSDSARVMNDNSIYTCAVQTCINYPWKAISLVLDYLNLFVNLLNINR